MSPTVRNMTTDLFFHKPFYRSVSKGTQKKLVLVYLPKQVCIISNPCHLGEAWQHKTARYATRIAGRHCARAWWLAPAGKWHSQARLTVAGGYFTVWPTMFLLKQTAIIWVDVLPSGPKATSYIQIIGHPEMDKTCKRVAAEPKSKTRITYMCWPLGHRLSPHTH